MRTHWAALHWAVTAQSARQQATGAPSSESLTPGRWPLSTSWGEAWIVLIFTRSHSTLMRRVYACPRTREPFTYLTSIHPSSLMLLQGHEAQLMGKSLCSQHRRHPTLVWRTAAIEAAVWDSWKKYCQNISAANGALPTPISPERVGVLSHLAKTGTLSMVSKKNKSVFSHLCYISCMCRWKLLQV